MESKFYKETITDKAFQLGNDRNVFAGIKTKWVPPHLWDGYMDKNYFSQNDNNIKANTKLDLSFSENITLPKFNVTMHQKEFWEEELTKIKYQTIQFKLPKNKCLRNFELVLPRELMEELHIPHTIYIVQNIIKDYAISSNSIETHIILCTVVTRRVKYIDDCVHIPLFLSEMFENNIMKIEQSCVQKFHFTAQITTYNRNVDYNLVKIKADVFTRSENYKKNEKPNDLMQKVSLSGTSLSVLTAVEFFPIFPNKWFNGLNYPCICQAILIYDSYYLYMRQKAQELRRPIQIESIEIAGNKLKSHSRIYSYDKLIKIKDHKGKKVMAWIVPLCPQTSSLKKFRHWIEDTNAYKSPPIGINMARIDMMSIRINTEKFIDPYHCYFFNAFILSKNQLLYKGGVYDLLFQK